MNYKGDSKTNNYWTLWNSLKEPENWLAELEIGERIETPRTTVKGRRNHCLKNEFHRLVIRIHKKMEFRVGPA